MKNVLLTIGAIVLTAGCTWVSENEKAQSVAIRELADVTNCQKIGNISVSTKSKIGFINRGDKKILDELQTLARNEALKLNANVIVANSEPQEGKQSYQAFSCL